METVTGEEHRGNDEEAEESDTEEAEVEDVESEERDGDESEEGERDKDGEEIGVRTRPAKTEPGNEHENVLIDEGALGPGTGSGADLQGESRAPSRVSTALSRLSRSPPRSRSPSPDTLAKMTGALTLRSVDVRERVATDLAKRQRQQKKYHSKRGGGRAGRAQGSKAKQDQRVKLNGGVWD